MALLLPDGGCRGRSGPAGKLRPGQRNRHQAEAANRWGPPVSNRIAILLAGLILTLILLDLALTGGGGLLFALRKFADTVEWISFWR